MLRNILTLIITCLALVTVFANNHNASGHDRSILERPNFMTLDYTNVNEDSSDQDDMNFQLIAELLLEADKHLGTRYRRGGKTPNGFDCSGFTSYVYKQFGYKLGASSRDQFKQGIESTDNVKPGDLLFFKGSRSSTVGHVAIAIDTDPETGDIIFIHAALKGGIRVDRISSPYYSKRYVGARRVIN